MSRTLETRKIKTFNGFGLIEELMKAIDDAGFVTLSPIRLKTFPALLESKKDEFASKN